MRFFTTVATFGLAAFALAQESSSATSTSAAASGTAALSPEQRCIADCGETDICCKAACVNVPCPNEQAINQTTECAGKCIQGNGTEEETASYAACQQSCISASFFPIATNVPGNTASGSGAEATTTGETASGMGGSETSATGSGSQSASRTGSSSSSASASATGSSGANIKMAMSGAGLFGLIVAGIAL